MVDDTFDILSLFKLLSKHIKIIIAVSVAFGIAAYLISAILIQKKYTSSVQLYVENKSAANETTSLTTSDISVAQQLVDTCSIIFTSSAVFDQLAKEVDYTSEELASMVSVGAVNKTEVMKITVTCTSPKEAKLIAQKLCEICITEYERIISTGTIRAIDQPKESKRASYPNNKLYGLTGLLIGFCLTCFIIILRNLLDTRVKPDDNLAEIYDIPVFAEIMDFENKTSIAHSYRYESH